MIRNILLGLLFAALVSSSTLAGIPELKSAAENAVDTIEKMKQDAPNAKTAAQAAALVRSLAGALERFAVVTATMKKDQPDLLKNQEVPPELVAVYERWTKASAELGPTMEQLSKVLEPNAQDPEVQKAAAELQTAVQDLAQAMQ